MKIVFIHAKKYQEMGFGSANLNMTVELRKFEFGAKKKTQISYYKEIEVEINDCC